MPQTIDSWEVSSGLKLPKGKSGRWILTYKEFEPGHVFYINTVRDLITSGDKPASVKFPTKTRIYQLNETKKGSRFGHLWMTDLPAEVYSHVHHLKDFYGRVLVGGLGIGLAVSYLERHPFVSEIVVVEKSRDVCKLVWPHLKTKKTRLVNQDLFKYLSRERRPQTFDWAFLDIWRGTSEHVLWNCVMPLRMLASRVVSPKHTRCWKEGMMLGQVRLSIEIQIAMNAMPADKGMLLNLFTMPEEQFLSFRDGLGPKWAFYNWARKNKPSEREMHAMIPGFVEALTDYDAWHKDWAKYYGLPIERGNSKCGY